MTVDARRNPRVERFLARRGGRIGIWTLAILGTLAAWAPFLANDRPYVLVAADRGSLERARDELAPLAESLARIAHAAEDAGNAASPGARESIADEARGIEARLGVLETATGAAALAELRRALSASRAGSARSADELVTAARTVRDAFADGRLVPPTVRTFPLFASLDALDVFCALLPLAGLAAWSLRRRLGLGRALLVACGSAVALAAIVGIFAEKAPFAAPGALKAAVARGVLQVDQAWFPPIPFGYAETNLAEAWRPPTWLPAGRLDAEGRSPSTRDVSAPSAGRPAARYGEPAIESSWRHVLGTDALGRDVAARTLWGGRISLTIGVLAALLLSAIGALLGAAAGFLGGVADTLVSRTIEVVLCFPAFFLVLCAIAWTDPDVVPVPFAIVLVIAAVGWTSTARLVRAESLRVAASDHVLAARALGLHPARVLVRHVLPNAIGPALVAFGFAAGGAIGVESSLAFLGLGAQVPLPSWGGLVGEARGADQAWAWIAPGMLVFLAVLAWVLVAEAAREALDPRAAVEPSP
ncbi:MAG: ABC transporter permease [Planctomycetota bacterium]|nr:ABC transporter permease [Planctomycetota bacterium]